MIIESIKFEREVRPDRKEFLRGCLTYSLYDEDEGNFVKYSVTKLWHYVSPLPLQDFMQELYKAAGKAAKARKKQGPPCL